MTTPTQPSSDHYTTHHPTYHTDTQSQYILPNSTPEHERLETQAKHLSNITSGRIIHAPLNPLTIDRILDIGCGTGVVTSYLAHQYPQAQAIGLDISPVPHRLHTERPPNLTFTQGNILTQPPSQWKPSTPSPPPLPDASAFNLTYSRLLLAGISNWPLYLRNCFDLLQPGGWTEIHDLDWTWYRLAPFSSTGKEELIPDTNGWLYNKLKTACKNRGIDFSCGSKAAGWMKDAGFEDIHVHTYHWPFGGDWETEPVYREFGDYVAREMPGMFHHLIARTMEGVASEQEIERMRAAMRKDMRSDKGKVWKYYVTYGRKPI